MWPVIMSHCDYVVDDLEFAGHYDVRPNTLDARRLQIVSPRSPQAVGLLILLEEKPTSMRQWEQEFHDRAEVVKALGMRYAESAQWADAERCLRRFLEITPDQWGFAELAKVYLRQNDREKWKETLDESLKHEDFALSHAQTRVSIARYLMNQKKWDEALLYADAAAQTGASWAMKCAAECHEALEHWEEADQLMRANSERYSTEQFEWYLWCRRTGHGDVQAALQLAQVKVNSVLNSDLENDHDMLGLFYLLTKQHALAKDSFLAGFKPSGNPHIGVHYVLLADELGDTAGRDAALADIAARGPNYRRNAGGMPSTVAFAHWLDTSYHEPKGTAPDLDALEAILKQAPRPELTNLAYFAGRYFQDLGDTSLARKYWQRSIDSEETGKRSYALARVCLRELSAETDGG
jgi:tetratricopeptide (TPR) repeat protein